MEHRSGSNKRGFFGLFLIALGLIWAFKRMDIFPDYIDDILISWQMLLVGIGLFSLIGGNRTTGIILILIGGFFMIPEMVQIPYELRKLGWPLLLVIIGVILLSRHRKKDEPAPIMDPRTKSTDYFDDFIIFGGREIFVNSQSLLGGKTTSIFGGTEYDMRRCSLSSNGAVVDCLCIFGGCTFKVPPDWTIKNEVTTIFGAFSDKRGSSLFQENKMDHSRTLVIKGFTAFGGIEVKLI